MAFVGMQAFLIFSAAPSQLPLLCGPLTGSLANSLINDGSASIARAAAPNAPSNQGNPPISQVLTPYGTTWRYLDDGSNQGTAWRETNFDDTSWPSGPAPLGYGDALATTIGYGPEPSNKYITSYFSPYVRGGRPGAIRIAGAAAAARRWRGGLSQRRRDLSQQHA
ncbi:MAG: hypothetical protein HC853_09665 [Anaerolineae bacterium]|nr:hypothetical protein [Anaerolineae bacterium]